MSTDTQVIYDQTEKCTMYVVNNLLHRQDGPAIVYDNGLQQWYLNGVQHRIGGPSHYHPDGTAHWMQFGKYHRVDGPAINFAFGQKQWRLNGLFHRTDGPAIETPIVGANRWYVHGIRFQRDQSIPLSDQILLVMLGG